MSVLEWRQPVQETEPAAERGIFMNKHKRIPVAAIAVGCCAALWLVLLLWYERGLDPTDVMGYGILTFFLLWPAAALLASLAVSASGFRWRWVFPVGFGAAELLLILVISGIVQGILLFLLPAAASLVGTGLGALIRTGMRRKEKHSARMESSAADSFDRLALEPALRCSICTGEQVAGFLDRKTGKFQEVSVIASREDLDRFLKTWKISEQELKKIY